MKKTICSMAVGISLLAATNAGAREVSVEVTNLTNATYFTPLLVAVHGPSVQLFEVGGPASVALQAMAEGGDIAGLSAEVQAGGGQVVENPAEGLLGPGMSTSATLDVGNQANARLSIAAMVLPSNDGFIALNGADIPLRSGVHYYKLPVFDAGTEANDEVVNGNGAPGQPGIPADPSGAAGINGTGVTGADHNPNVHIHPGIVGDHDPVGGLSDLDPAVHRWGYPVAVVKVTVSR